MTTTTTTRAAAPTTEDLLLDLLKLSRRMGTGDAVAYLVDLYNDLDRVPRNTDPGRRQLDHLLNLVAAEAEVRVRRG